jgi:soluble lytic murein transglycosylase-like protein
MLTSKIYIFTLVIVVGIFIVFPALSIAQELPNVDSKKWTNKYDQYFKKYTKHFFGVGFDWKWIKAQAIAESSLKEDAQSWAKAKGIMQIVPRTFEEIQKENPSFISLDEPRWNIAAGVYYDKWQYRLWNEVGTVEDRISFMLGSYNAGRGTILRAQRVSIQEGLPGNRWEHIETVAPKVRRWRYNETIGYVEKIFKLMEKNQGM